MGERRKARRYEVYLPVQVYISRRRPAEYQTAQLRDISRTGVYFHCAAALEPGTKMQLTFALPTERQRAHRLLPAHAGQRSGLRAKPRHSQRAYHSHCRSGRAGPQASTISPEMASQPHSEETPAVEIERQLLRAMCGRRVSRQQISGAIDRLANYVWLVPEHAIVFQAIRGAVRHAHGSLPELLPAQATRMGFPDVDWPEYFTKDGRESLPLNTLLRRLIG